MATPAILAIDQGTTNTKALLTNGAGDILARASRPMTLIHPRPGWSEQSADDIWASVRSAIADALAQAPGVKVAGIAISNQRETVMLWDADTGKALGPAISWQCRRTSDRCARLREGGHEAEVTDRTGLGLDPLFPATKLAWLLDSVPDARRRAASGTLRTGTIDSWLLWKLTGGGVHATDHGNASRTQLLNLQTLAWDEQLLALFDVPRGILPQVQASNSHFGVTASGATALPAGIPIHAMMGDSHAALFGHGIRAAGEAKVTIGTGSSIMALTDGPVMSSNGLSTTIAWSDGDGAHYALEGNITVSGQAAAFVTRLLGLADAQALSDLAQTVDDSGGVTFVPALAGLGAPHWNDGARAAFAGMSLGSGPAHLARATLEAIACQIVDVCHAMESDQGTGIPIIASDGGATRNDFLMQLLADLLDRPVRRTADAELSALGAGRMAGEALGLRDPNAEAGIATVFAPTMPADRRNAIRRGWTQAVRNVLTDR